MYFGILLIFNGRMKVRTVFNFSGTKLAPFSQLNFCVHQCSAIFVDMKALAAGSYVDHVLVWLLLKWSSLPWLAASFGAAPFVTTEHLGLCDDPCDPGHDLKNACCDHNE